MPSIGKGDEVIIITNTYDDEVITITGYNLLRIATEAGRERLSMVRPLRLHKGESFGEEKDPRVIDITIKDGG